jgi:transcriptional regulator with GAF, ATPase, and Fis domain
MNRIFELIDTVASLTSTILIQGETGTGKELIGQGRFISTVPRKEQKMISINCGAIPENLLESELLVTSKGAFTGAVTTRVGRFEQANGGTLFLDEIGNMPQSLQSEACCVFYRSGDSNVWAVRGTRQSSGCPQSSRQRVRIWIRW